MIGLIKLANQTMGKERLDILMVNRNLAESRSLAQKLIMAGDVLVNDQVAYKPSQTFECSVEIKLKAKTAICFQGGIKTGKSTD